MRGKKPGFMTHLRAAYRSGLEVAIAAALSVAGIDGRYEQAVIPFTQPAKARKYHADFVLPNGIIIESKGLFASEDRQKHEWLKAQHPELDIRFVFSNPNAKLYSGSPTTYAMWCAKRGFRFAKKEIPQEWLDEPVDPAKVASVEAYLT